jgi:hypothetical protein
MKKQKKSLDKKRRINIEDYKAIKRLLDLGISNKISDACRRVGRTPAWYYWFKQEVKQNPIIKNLLKEQNEQENNNNGKEIEQLEEKFTQVLKRSEEWERMYLRLRAENDKLREVLCNKYLDEIINGDDWVLDETAKIETLQA